MEVKLKRNRRFVQLRQQFADQETLLQARQEADMKRNKMFDCPGWKNKPRTRTINLYLIASSFAASSNSTSLTKNFSPSKSDGESQQKSSVRTRLSDRASIRSIRSKGSGNNGQLPDLEETVATSLSGLRFMDWRRSWIP